MNSPISKLILFAVILAFFACDQHEKGNTEKSLVLEKEVEIAIPFPTRWKDSGIFYKDGRPFYYFPDLTTHKKLLIYDEQGSRVDSVNLRRMHKALGGMQAMTLINPDSILCFNELSGDVGLVNNNGKLLWKRNFTKFVKDSLMLGSTYAGSFYNNGSLFFGCGVAHHLQKKPITEADMLYNGRLRFEKPHIIEFRNIFDTNSMEIKSYFDGFYSTFLSPEDFFVEKPFYTLSNDTTFIAFSWYTDTVFRVNLQTGKHQKFRLQSDYSELIVPPIPRVESLTRSINDHTRVFGMINRVVYDSYRELYYTSFLHHTEGNEEGGKYRDFSIGIYDSNFNKLEEVKFDPREYFSSFFVSKDGLVLIKYRMEEYDNPTKVKHFTFQTYAYEN
jgi:hypothetical protein